MDTFQSFISCIVYASLPLLVFSDLSIAVDVIAQNQSITGGKTLVSSGKTFELGFFSRGKSNNRFLGIWYKTTPNTVVWVANRNNPLKDSHGELTITKNGNLVLLNQTRNIIWSSNSSSSAVSKDPIARLLETGNLVLVEDGIYLWQSFDYPTDTLLAGMKLGWDINTGLERYLSSWKSIDDPSIGDYSFRLEMKGLPQIVLSMGSTRLLRSGAWNGVRFSGNTVFSDTVFKPVFVFNEKESYYMYEPTSNSVVTRLTLNISGVQQRLILQSGSTEWAIMYSLPYQPCDSYGYCGPNGFCRISDDPICDCLKGFIPKSATEWEVLNWSNGCTRKSPLDCQRGEGFVSVVGLKLPDFVEFQLNKSMSLDECKEMCLKNCSCTAYANSDIRNGGSGCLMWFGDLIDVRELHVEESEQETYIRLSASEIKSIRDANKRKRIKIILSASIASGIITLCLVFWCTIWKIRRAKGLGDDEEIELPLFDFATIANATNNFSPSSMIGAGGFGSVYKGKLPTGQDIAVKRLSKDSRQGLKEFKNEVELIAKLQHRNLVALLGCCIQGEERILIYEYMPNKSLDHFIFENTRRATLAWQKHFDIIMGIARGLLYLHRDSKLHIIHRDLKASNVLLDNKLNSKISDFGLARIFGDDEKEVRTRRIVGTYGYMSPEYAIDGKFSIKSDVFSFGVLLLEIVSGKRNRRFSHPDHYHNLLGHAWLLWKEDKVLDLMDECFKDSGTVEEVILRCIQVGLLCVQKLPQDRPSMSSVVFMLENEEAILPEPKQPGFFTERGTSDESSTSRVVVESHTENGVTITMPNGR